MIQGTSSDVGKSMVVAGLCRAFARRGLTVRPFKAQNMSNNAAVAADSDLPAGPDGETPRGEIGRAQALQARACRAAPSIHMNPVLLKPQSEIGAQVVLRGRVLGNCPAKIYHHMRRELMPAVLDSFERLASESDLVLVEGAGSGAEVYLRSSDITNMRFAEEADLPVVFLSDIDRGGTMGALVGSWALLGEADRARVVGYIINKFRGDFSIFEPGCRTITERTGWPFLGVLRWFPAADRLPAEDSAGARARRGGKPGQGQGGGPAPAAGRQFRRPRPAGRRAGSQSAMDPAGFGHSRRRRRGGDSGLEGDADRARPHPARRLGHRHSRPRPARRPGRRPLRRLSDARPRRARPDGDRGASRRQRGARPARSRNRHVGRQASRRDRRRRPDLGRPRDRLRDAHGTHHGSGARPAVAEAGSRRRPGHAGRRGLA